MSEAISGAVPRYNRNLIAGSAEQAALPSVAAARCAVLERGLRLGGRGAASIVRPGTHASVEKLDIQFGAGADRRCFPQRLTLEIADQGEAAGKYAAMR
jgi:hypothetical protein